MGQHHKAGPSSPTTGVAHLGLFFLLVGGRTKSASAELTPRDAQTPVNPEALPDATFQNKVAILISQGPESIKCFTQTLSDLTCFWEVEEKEDTVAENPPYRFYYQVEEDPEKTCSLSTQRTLRGKKCYVCSFPTRDVSAFAIYNLRITTSDGHTTLHNRTFMVDQVVLLDPPLNLSVQEKSRRKQLVIRWSLPNAYNIRESINYQVNISSSDTDLQKVEVVNRKTELVLTNVKGHTAYTIAVRAKPDEVSYNGYWSAWSEPVTVVTSKDLDILMLVLAFTMVLSVLIVSGTLLLTHRRYLKKKIWPVIPDPSNHFQGLFTTHKGNFQQWLGHSSSYLWWRPNLHPVEGLVASMEVLSELSPALPGFPPPQDHAQVAEEIPIFAPQLHSSAGGQGAGTPMPSHLPPLTMDSYVVLGENLMPCRVPTEDTALRIEDHVPHLPLRRQESMGTEFSSSGKESGEEGEQDSGRSGSYTSGSPGASHEEQTSSSSFEYAIFDPAKLALCSRPRATPTDPKYPYLLISDSGVSTGYSSMNCGSGLYSNLYENDVMVGAFQPNLVIYSPC
ncbi:erythropoietin receptor [Ambystoma mexicanum]|uniref:erythropoietin receptor n=1 Tax=Ambystoma mexicanum TaxID=8296 RepID=UPI0037E7B5EA